MYVEEVLLLDLDHRKVCWVLDQKIMLDLGQRRLLGLRSEDTKDMFGPMI